MYSLHTSIAVCMDGVVDSFSIQFLLDVPIEGNLIFGMMVA